MTRGSTQRAVECTDPLHEPVEETRWIDADTDQRVGLPGIPARGCPPARRRGREFDSYCGRSRRHQTGLQYDRRGQRIVQVR